MEYAKIKIEIPISVQDVIYTRFQDYQDQNFELGYQIVINGYPLNQGLLQKCVNYLQDQEQNEQQYKILEMATENQDIPNKIYKYILIERAALSIKNGFQDKADAIDYLDKQIQKGIKLTYNDILKNCKNKGDIPQKLIKTINQLDKEQKCQNLIKKLNDVNNNSYNELAE